MKSYAKFIHFHWRKFIWKCHLENGGNFFFAFNVNTGTWSVSDGYGPKMPTHQLCLILKCTSPIHQWCNQFSIISCRHILLTIEHILYILYISYTIKRLSQNVTKSQATRFVLKISLRFEIWHVFRCQYWCHCCRTACQVSICATMNILEMEILW